MYLEFVCPPLAWITSLTRVGKLSCIRGQTSVILGNLMSFLSEHTSKLLSDRWLIGTEINASLKHVPCILDGIYIWGLCGKYIISIPWSPRYAITIRVQCAVASFINQLHQQRELQTVTRSYPVVRQNWSCSATQQSLKHLLRCYHTRKRPSGKSSQNFDLPMNNMWR